MNDMKKSSIICPIAVFKQNWFAKHANRIKIPNQWSCDVRKTKYFFSLGIPFVCGRRRGLNLSFRLATIHLRKSSLIGYLYKDFHIEDRERFADCNTDFILKKN